MSTHLIALIRRQLESQQTEQALAAVKVTEGSLFSQGKSAGIHHGLALALQTIDKVVKEDAERERTNKPLFD